MNRKEQGHRKWQGNRKEEGHRKGQGNRREQENRKKQGNRRSKGMGRGRSYHPHGKFYCERLLTILLHFRFETLPVNEKYPNIIRN